MLDIFSIQRTVEKNFPYFGINKKNEIIRLLYEISKKEKINFLKITRDLKGRDFSFIKKILLERRYPYTLLKEKEPRFYLPILDIQPENKLRIKKFKLYPKKIYFEKETEDLSLLKRFKRFFPRAEFIQIETLKDYLKAHGYTLKDYNLRKESFFIVKEKYDFLKNCPCTKDALNCGYSILNLGFGCPYECIYCYLQEYTDSAGIIFSGNLEDFFRYFKKFKRSSKLRIGSGEFTDSLFLDDITQYSVELINFFRDYPDIYFEFKTKSKNIDFLLNAKSSKNIVISWSLNPQKIIKECEFYTADLKERIVSAVKCIEAGFKVGFHFDPIIYYEGWQYDYKELLNYLFDKIKEDSILWISLGTLRFNPRLKKIIENRFPENKILDEELILGFDGKLRYPKEIRFNIYKKMLEFIRKRAKHLWVYLCMEERVIWQALKEFGISMKNV
ncbi:MAG: hypothetical protein NC826_02630 [Candidatus Omnitrophica bacterium]|nr:hypothetical protein [Candidatus Omnitrophota bacterium]